jgi:hypothetical protein
MCRRVTCDGCGKPTYAGCGAHVEQVLGDVPEERRCHCREERSQGRGGGEGGVVGWIKDRMGL